MDEIDKFIIDISKEIEPFVDDINWEYFEKKYDLDKFYMDFNEFNSFNYIDSVEWVINNAFNENPENCIKMLEYICYKNQIPFDFSLIKNEINLLEKNNLIDFPISDPEDFRVFISYSNKDIEEAMRIYQIFNDAGIHCFFASEEIKAGEKWDDKIFEELISADIFIFLISKNYKNSFWCNQEASIGFLKFKLNESIIIPLLLDEEKPFGIFYSIQGDNSKKFKTIEDFSKLINSDAISFESAIETFNYKKEKELNEKIDKLRFSNSFDESNIIIKDFKNKRLSVSHVQKIIDYAQLNNQVLGCYEFAYLFNKYNIRYEDELDRKSIDEIKRLLK